MNIHILRLKKTIKKQRVRLLLARLFQANLLVAVKKERKK